MFFTFSIPAQASFENVGYGARTIGMGNAFVAVSDDVHALVHNPAGLSQIQRMEFSGSYGRLYLGLEDDSNLGSSFVGLAKPFKNRGTIGLSWHNFSLDGIYQENTFALGYGKNVMQNVSLGATIKRLAVDYTQDGYTRRDPVFDFGKKGSASALGFDFGILTKPLPSLSLGISFLNLNKPSVALQGTSKVPMEFKVGAALRQRSSVVAIDGGTRGKDFIINLGGEKWYFRRTFAARAGTELGNNNLRNLTVGFAFNLHSFQFDYAFVFPLGGAEGTSGNHRLGMTVRFGPDPVILAEKERQRRSMKDVNRILKRRKDGFFSRGHAHFSKKEYEIAILQWEEALKIDPNYTPAANAISRAKAKISEREESINKQMQDLKMTIGSLKSELQLNRERQNQTEDRLLRDRTRLALREAEARKARFEAEKLKLVLERKSKIESVRFDTRKASRRATTHRVVPGENLRTISKKIYGDADRWQDIYEANKKQIRRGSVIAGQVLIIP